MPRQRPSLWKDLAQRGHTIGRTTSRFGTVAVSGLATSSSPPVFFVHRRYGRLTMAISWAAAGSPGAPWDEAFYRRARGHRLGHAAIAVEADVGTSFIEITTPGPHQPRQLHVSTCGLDGAGASGARDRRRWARHARRAASTSCSCWGRTAPTKAGSDLQLGEASRQTRAGTTSGTRPFPRRRARSSFVTECGTGNLYMLATDNPNYGADPNRYGNNAYLRRVKYESRNMSLARVDPSDPTAFDLQFDSGTGDFCTFRAGVSPSPLRTAASTSTATPGTPAAATTCLKIAEFGWCAIGSERALSPDRVLAARDYLPAVFASSLALRVRYFSAGMVVELVQTLATPNVPTSCSGSNTTTRKKSFSART